MSKLSIIRNITFLKPIIDLRDKIMDRYGLFKKKQLFKHRVSFLFIRIKDNLKRAKYRIRIQHSKIKPLILSDGTNVTISMTSYNKRVVRFAPYALWSILQQSELPNRIILNLDKDKWNDSSIPRIIKRLKLFGIEINYTEDLGPHTKLIPTLKKYKNDIIITVDDDVYYDKDMIFELHNAFVNSDRRTVICREGKVLIKSPKCYLPYSEQPDIREYTQPILPTTSILPFGVAGVLYPPHIFGEEIFNEIVFRELCPLADDVWFGIMELYYGIKQHYVKDNSWSGNSIDRNEEYIEKGSSALHFQNDKHGKNDMQFYALINYYNID